MINSEVNKLVIEKANSSRRIIHIITAFLKFDAFKRVNDVINVDKVVEKHLLVRGRKEDFANKSLDLIAIEYAFANGWAVYFNQSLHAKLYCFDDETAIIGSANLTNLAFDECQRGNLELVTSIHLEYHDIQKIKNILNNSHRISDGDLKEIRLFCEEMGSYKIEEINRYKQWNFEKESSVDFLFPEDLIDCSNFANLSETTCSIIGIDGNCFASAENLIEQFQTTNEYKWLVGLLNKENNRELSFGKISYEMHNSIVTNKRVFRKDIKNYVSILFDWIEFLNIVNVEIVKADYTKLVKLRE